MRRKTQVCWHPRRCTVPERVCKECENNVTVDEFVRLCFLFFVGWEFGLQSAAEGGRAVGSAGEDWQFARARARGGPGAGLRRAPRPSPRPRRPRPRLRATAGAPAWLVSRARVGCCARAACGGAVPLAQTNATSVRTRRSKAR